MTLTHSPRMRDRRLIEGVVPSLPLFRGALPNQIEAVARRCWVLPASRGEVVAARNVRLPGVFAVAYGTVELALRETEGRERVLRLVQAGQTFGYSTALLDRPARYEAHALTESKLVVIPSVTIFHLIERDPRASRQILRTLAEHNFERLSELESAGMRNAAQRLAWYLDSLPEPCIRNGSYTARLPAAKTVIASHLDMKKETLSRMLRLLTQQGVIEVTKRDITILDRERLAKLAGR